MRIAPIYFVLTMLFQSKPASASLRDWFLGEPWDFIQSVGGIAVDEPSREPNGEVLLPVRCDVSGLQTITRPPTVMNSALIVRRVSTHVRDQDVELAVKTSSLTDKKSSSRCEGVKLGNLPAGPYQIYYRGADRIKHLIAEVQVPPTPPVHK